MKERYPYARWATERINQITKEEDRKETRPKYFSNSGKLIKFENYLQFCREGGYQPDPAPDGYWESRVKTWHSASGVMGVFMMMFLYLIVGLAKGSMLPTRR